ncbi:MAG: ParA family protein [Spirosomaceae bacterium]|jgi:chromosome partitioning protein|nr:ParA family protein [Spirosomataceae bacterium]
MKIITVAHQKGGVGKTTLSVNLATFFKDHLKVGLLDGDPQESITGLGSLLEGVKIIAHDNLSNLTTIQNDIDLLVIDTPPYLTSKLPELFDISDYVLIPTKVGYLDVMAIKATISLLKDAQKRRPNLKSGVVLNMVKNRTSINDEIKKIIQSYEIPLHNTVICDRVSYTRSVISSGVMDGQDEKAKEEITNLAEEIIESLK